MNVKNGLQKAYSFSKEKILPNEEGEFSLKRLLERIFFDDWMMKLLALVITLALWFGVTGTRTPTTERLKSVTLKLRISNVMELTNSPVSEVDLVVTGDLRRIDQIRSEDLTVSVNLVDVQPGVLEVQLTPDNVEVALPTGVHLESIQPSKIGIKLETVERREITVKADTEDNLPEGFELYGVTVIPQKVPARGPSSYIDSIDHILTEKIDLKDHKTDFTAQQVPLRVENSRISVIDETSVNVFFRIGERRIERIFFVPISNDSKKRTAEIRLYGVISLLRPLRIEEVKAKIVKFDSGSESIAVELPPELQESITVRENKIK